jgi:hypothetical protein
VSDIVSNFGSLVIFSHVSWRNSRVGMIGQMVGDDETEKLCYVLIGS